MPSPVDHRPTADDDAPIVDASSITAVRLLAIAITALLVSFLVVDRTSTALSAGAATPPAELRAGRVRLIDDDGDRTMFDVGDLLPGRPIVNCIGVDYEGTVFDGAVELRGRGAGDLAPYLDVRIESGTGGGFGDCAGFRPGSVVFEGTLARLLRRHGPDGEAVEATRLRDTRQRRTFRATLAVRDVAAAEGATASFELLWSIDT